MVFIMRKFLESFFKAMEASAKRKADYELKRMGYTPERLREFQN